jgi:hypothetical protein
MSKTQRPEADDTRKEPTNTPSYHAIAARLEVDAETLRRFVIDHPNPSVAVVLGWAQADPAHAPVVEEWLSAREEQAAARHDRLVAEHDADDLNKPGRNVFTDGAGEISTSGGSQ